MKTVRRRNVERERCYLGRCHNPAHHEHHFDIDLEDGKPYIRIHACSKDHLEWLRIGHHRFEVKSGG